MICFSVMLFMSGTASSSWNCMPARPISAYFFIFSSRGMLLRWPGPKVSLPSWTFHGPAVNLNVAMSVSSCIHCLVLYKYALEGGWFLARTAFGYHYHSGTGRFFNVRLAFFIRQSCDFNFFSSLSQIRIFGFVRFINERRKTFFAEISPPLRHGRDAA